MAKHRSKKSDQIFALNAVSVHRPLLRWYDGAARDLPWRAKPGARRSPAYHVWLSEIMLQQTTVATVGPYFHAFLRRWPEISNLSCAELDEVLHLWQGLGYYARARNLHKCAKLIATDYDGRFPSDEVELLKLPGVGPYTAAAITAIAFNRRASPVDGNIERVVARIAAIETELPAAKPEIKALAATLVPAKRPGDYVQAMMDLGASICRPKGPDCPACPLKNTCAAHALGLAAELPRRAAKTPKPNRHGMLFWLTDAKGRILVRRRAEKGLLGGMMEFPSTPWRPQEPWTKTDALRYAPIAANWQMAEGKIKHTFTHFHLHFDILTAVAENFDATALNGTWCPADELHTLALPTLMKKAAHQILG